MRNFSLWSARYYLSAGPPPWAKRKKPKAQPTNADKERESTRHIIQGRRRRRK